MSRSAQFTDEFQRLDITMLYRLGVVGPKLDRARRHSGPSPVYCQTWQRGTEHSALRAQLEAGVLTVDGPHLGGAELVRLGSYSQGLFGGASRLTLKCPSCGRRCFTLFAPTPSTLIRPDGTENQRRLLCRHCHRLSIPAWRFDGNDRERALLQRRTLQEKLGDQPTERQPGCSVTRHQKRLTRLLRAEGRVLGVGIQ